MGLTMQLPEKDKYSQSKTYLKSRLSILFGGRLAEELTFGDDKVSTGASNDIQVATSIARHMVTEWGMSETLGPIAYEEPEGEVFLGHSITRHKNISEKTAEEVDRQIRKIIDEAYTRTKEILTTHHDELKALAEALMEYETLNGDEIKQVLKGEKLTHKEEKPVFVRPSVPTVWGEVSEKEKPQTEKAPEPAPVPKGKKKSGQKLKEA